MILYSELVKAGALVDEIVAYRTIIEPDNDRKYIEQIQSGQIDLITFTSSSTVKNFVKLVGKDHICLLNKVLIACIGPITKQTALDFGFDVKIVPNDYTIPALVEAIINHYST